MPTIKITRTVVEDFHVPDHYVEDDSPLGKGADEIMRAMGYDPDDVREDVMDPKHAVSRSDLLATAYKAANKIVPQEVANANWTLTYYTRSDLVNMYGKRLPVPKNGELKAEVNEDGEIENISVVFPEGHRLTEGTYLATNTETGRSVVLVSPAVHKR